MVSTISKMVVNSLTLQDNWWIFITCLVSKQSFKLKLSAHYLDVFKNQDIGLWEKYEEKKMKRKNTKKIDAKIEGRRKEKFGKNP